MRMYFLLLFFLVNIFGCNNAETVSNEKLAKAYDYLLSPNNHSNIVIKNNKVMDVKGFRNFVFSKNYKDYVSMLPASEISPYSDTVLGVKYDEIEFYNQEYFKKYPLNGAPIYGIVLYFLNNELVQIETCVYNDNTPGGYKLTLDEKNRMRNFFASAYGYNYVEDGCVGFQLCHTWTFPTTIVEYNYTAINFFLILSKADKKQLLEQIIDEMRKSEKERRERMDNEKKFEEEQERKRKESEQIKKEL